MNSDEIKRDIANQISKTNDSFIIFLGLSLFSGLLVEDMDSLNKLSKKVSKYFKFYHFMSIALSAFFFIIILLQFFNIIHKDLNNAGLAIGFTIFFLLNTYSYYKVKVNLEHKIYLLGLRNRIDGE